MIQAYPLQLDGVEFRCHNIVGIYEFHSKIAYIHFAFSTTSSEEDEKEEYTPSFAMMDLFSADFKEHKQSHLVYKQEDIFHSHDADCYWEDNRFLLNTKRFAGFSPAIAKIIEIRDTGLIEVGNSQEPIVQISTAGKTYTFGDMKIHMASSFIMECWSEKSGELIWKLKLTAYLYTEIEEKGEILYFGTAGKGGRFYGVTLTDGNVLFNYDTGGTVHYVWHEGNVLLANRKGKPILLNSQNGSLEGEFEFGKFKITTDQYMMITDGGLYAVAERANKMYAVCVDL